MICRNLLILSNRKILDRRFINLYQTLQAKRTQELEKKVRVLIRKVATLEAACLPNFNRTTDFEMLPANSTVGKDYVAYRFGCKESSVTRGFFGTNIIPRACKKPLKFIKHEVDRCWREKNKTASEIAAEMFAQAKPRRRKSLIRRTPK